MSRTRLWQVLIPVLSIAALISAFTLVLAGPPAQEPPSSEQGAGPPPPSGAPAGDEGAADRDGYAGDRQRQPYAGEASEVGAQQTTLVGAQPAPQPDENGYTGERATGDLVAMPSSEEDALSVERGPQAPPDWESFFSEPQPDEDAFYTEGDVSLQGWSPLFYYVHIAGTALRPRDSSIAWHYGGGGCVYVGDLGQALNIHLQLPDGVRIDYLRIYYWDVSATKNGTAWLTRYDHTGSFVDLIAVSSTGDSGYGTWLSDAYLQVADIVSYAHVLNWKPDIPGPGVQLCGLQVAYRLPV